MSTLIRTPSFWLLVVTTCLVSFFVGKGVEAELGETAFWISMPIAWIYWGFVGFFYGAWKAGR